MPTFKVRQKEVYYEDFEVEAETAEEAIEMVNEGDAKSINGPEYLETTNTYLLADDGIFEATNQPENATPLDEESE